MDTFDFLILEGLNRTLMSRDYDRLGLENLDRLRMEVYIKLEQEKLKGNQCKHDKIYYCLHTGGNRCRECKKLL
jgi:hypothetical protein